MRRCVFSRFITGIYKDLSTGSQSQWGNRAAHEFQFHPTSQSFANTVQPHWTQDLTPRHKVILGLHIFSQPVPRLEVLVTTRS